MMKYLYLALFFCFVTTSSYAKDNNVETPLDVNSVVAPELSAEELKVEAEKKKLQSVLDSLESTQIALDEKRKEQTTLQRQFRSVDPTEKASAQAELDELNLEIKNLKNSFEQVAIGGIRLEAFGLKEETFDWKEELVLITQPVIESLKDLTEKPRNLERLRAVIADRRVRSEEIDKAVALLDSRLAAKPSEIIAVPLKKNLEEWQSKKKDNSREIELAQVQLDSLLGNNTPWYERIIAPMKSFVSGRGTTLAFALIVSIIIWQVMKGLLLLIRKRTQSGKSTRRRIFAYLYKFLTTLMVIIAIMVVLYVRGDLLLLALMVIVFVGLALAIRSYLPAYIIEAKTLLDLGTVREEELVIYNGIPWQVHHINMQSILINPEIYGVLRIPLSELVNLKSRPAGRVENWFPCQKGDFLLMPGDVFAEVLSQTPDSVELQTKGGMRLSYPSASIFEMGFYNLSRGESYSSVSIFGIDYSHVDISLTKVPEQFKQAVEEGLNQSGLGEHVLDVTVDFKMANSSSLDYIVIVSMHSRAASSYFKVARIIQQNCVKACTENEWGIPFPQLTVHSAKSS